MFRRWAGPLVSVLILGGVALILAMNLDLKSSTTIRSAPRPPPKQIPTPAASPDPNPAKAPPFVEHQIGDPVFKNHLKIAAVWLPPIGMDGGADGSGDVIHLEADIHATAENPNGFALGEFVPYLKIGYTIAPDGGGAAIQKGTLMPMVARDGLHYGASVAMPRAGAYRLTFAIAPPSAGGLGRHSDAATGVAAWWSPFSVSFDWDYPGPPGPSPKGPAAVERAKDRASAPP